MTNTRFYSRAARLLRLMRWGVALPLTLLPAACVSETGPDDSEPVESTELELTNTELIFGWAPILYQNTTQVSGGTGSNGRGDFMTSFDYDGDFNGQNNWDNMDSFSLPAKMYAAISESSTHYFIYYTMFHPRSWINSSFYDEHENDAESAVVLVRKDGTQFGKLEAVLTAFHSEGKAYRAATDVVDNPNNSITPGMITTEAWGFRSHPQLFMEAEGHGLAGCPSSVNCGISNANMIKYVPFDPSQPLQQPALPIQGTEQVGYRLIDLGDLFKRRFDRPTFFNAASMAGDESGSCGDGITVVCDDNKANAIWSYGLANTPECNNFGLGEDPASVFRAIFNFNSGISPSSTYVQNKLLHQKCDTGRKLQGSSDSCVQQICAVDSYCCNVAWDGQCQSEVGSICGKSCTNASACICATHAGPIGTGTDGQCAQRICAANVDPYCCNTAWDGQCVAEVASICGLNCSGLAGGNCSN